MAGDELPEELDTVEIWFPEFETPLFNDVFLNIKKAKIAIKTKIITIIFKDNGLFLKLFQHAFQLIVNPHIVIVSSTILGGLPLVFCIACPVSVGAWGWL